MKKLIILSLFTFVTSFWTIAQENRSIGMIRKISSSTQGTVQLQDSRLVEFIDLDFAIKNIEVGNLVSFTLSIIEGKITVTGIAKLNEQNGSNKLYNFGWLPGETTYEFPSESSVILTLPKGWKWVSPNSVEVAGLPAYKISYHCVCTTETTGGGGGCILHVYTNGTFNCEEKFPCECAGYKLLEPGELEPADSNWTYPVNFADGIQPIFNTNAFATPELLAENITKFPKSDIDPNTLIFAPAKLFEIPIIASHQEQFNKMVYPSGLPDFMLNPDIPVPSNFRYIPVYFLGYVILYPLPVTHLWLRNKWSITALCKSEAAEKDGCNCNASAAPPGDCSKTVLQSGEITCTPISPCTGCSYGNAIRLNYDLNPCE